MAELAEPAEAVEGRVVRVGEEVNGWAAKCWNFDHVAAATAVALGTGHNYYLFSVTVILNSH